MDRLPEIRKDIIRNWQREDNFNGKKDPLIAHMIAERQASIEGRLYLEAKQKGLIPSSKIPDLAEKELKEHRAQSSELRAQTKSLAEKIVQKYKLSERAAIDCAKNILRYKETHADKPTSGQIKNMVEISRKLEKKNYTRPTKELGSHEIEFLRRKEGDCLFKNTSFKSKLHYGYVNEHAEIQAKSSLKAATFIINQELSKINERGFSL